MPVFLFIIYIIIFSYFLTVIPFFKNAGIGRNSLLILFFIKIAAGIAYAKFFLLPKYYTTSDTWKFYRYSTDETKSLLHNPAAFIKDLFTNNYGKSGNLFSSQNSYWNDLKSNVIIKLMAVVNVFTNNSYYTNIIFFNFLFLVGLTALFRVFIEIFPEKKWLIIAGIFLLPSTLFWCSGIHKDGLILSSAGLIIYAFYRGFKSKFTTRRILLIVLCMLLIFSLRNYVFFALLPSLSAWWLCERYKGKSIKIFGFVYCAVIIFIVFLPFIFPSINIFSFISNKQHEFLLLEGGSKVNVPKLEPNAVSFISFLPGALDMAFFRPHITEVKNISYLPAIIENLLILLLLIVSIIFFRKKNNAPPVILCMFFFSISLMLLSGYTIPFTGALVRYRSMVLPFIITPLLCYGNFFFFRQKTGLLKRLINSLETFL